MTALAGQIDEMSRAIGKIEGALKTLDQYMHDFRHDEANRRQADQHFQDKVLANMDRIRRDMEAVREKDAHALAAIRVADLNRVQKIEEDVALLKAVNTRRDGFMGAVDYIFKSPLIGWVAAVGAAAWAALTGKVHL